MQIKDGDHFILSNGKIIELAHSLEKGVEQRDADALRR
jgi:hypothetical protein